MSEGDRMQAPRHGGLATISPERFDAVIFDLDGVVTDTREAHRAAWKRLFDSFLEARGDSAGEDTRPFDAEDYRRHVDGKPRYDGVRDFLASRGIDLPRGDPSDPADRETICGLGNRKNIYFHEWLAANRVRAFPDALEFIRAVRAAGLQTAIISSSRNCRAVLESAGIADLFDVRVDGSDMARLKLPGKPDPAIFSRAAKRMGAMPDRAAAIEDAIAGVEAGRRGGFALVVGVDRSGDLRDGDSLRAHGADVVTGDLTDLLAEEQRTLADLRPLSQIPSVWDEREEFERRLGRRRAAVFLDYDGTLTPIVEDFSEATLSEEMHKVLSELAQRYPVAVISGRDLNDVRNRVGIDTIFYAGSHGFDIAGPKGWREELQRGREFLPDLDAAESELRDAVEPVGGAAVERKTFSIAVHYRQASEDDVGAIEDAVDDALEAHPRLRKSRGKKVFQVQPRTDWDKGRALLWLLDRLDLDRDDVLPLYIGDDLTDEDAFRALAERPADGIGIVVRDGDDPRTTAARFALDGPEDVRRFLGLMIDLCRGDAR